MDEAPATSFRAVLKRRDFRRLLQSLAISSAGDWVYGVALVVYVFERTHSATWVGAASILRLLPYILFGAFGGVVADRFDRRRVMVVCDLGRGLLMLGLAALAATDAPVAAAIAIAFLATTIGTAHQPAFSALTPSLVPENQLASANSLVGIIDHVALVVGPGVAGLLLLVGDAWFAFLLNGVSFLASAAVIATVRMSQETPSTVHESILHRVRAGLREIVASSEVFVMVAFVVGASFMYGVELVVLVVVSENLLGTGSEGVGFLDAAIGAGGVLAATVVARLAQDQRFTRSLAIGIVLSSIPFAALALVTTPAIAYGLMVLVGGGGIIVQVVSETTLQRVVPGETLARVFGVLDAIAVGGILLGSLLAAPLVAVLGLKTTLVIAGAFLPATLILSAGKLRALDERSARRAAELAPRVEVLSSLPILAGASRASMEALAAELTEETVPTGSAIIREGEVADAFYVLTRGAADVLTGLGPGARRVNRLSAGDYFGEIGIVEGMPRTASVVATEDSVVIRISGEDFLQTVRQSSDAARTLMTAISGRLARTHPTYEPVGTALKEER